MAEPAKKIISLPASNQSLGNNNSIDDIRERRSQELIIGLCGASGSGVKTLKEKLIIKLKACNYHVFHIRISDLMAETMPAAEASDLKRLEGYEHFIQLQNLGNALRNKHGNVINSELVIRQIQVIRTANLNSGIFKGGAGKSTSKIAYIVDQLKHPDEVDLFREVYRNNFYLIGLVRTINERVINLKKDFLDDHQIAEIIRRDRRSEYKYGQHVEETLQRADYFIKNINNEQIKKSIARFIDLIHGANNVSPSQDETGMFTASSAALRSACLSRQVGAAIMDDNCNILSTGCNDVPAAGGGLYSCESKSDKRCYNNDGCHSDMHKDLVRREIEAVIALSDPLRAAELAKQIMKTKKIKSLIEYSRAIHAEMDAITTMARLANSSTVGKTLYCTTYPCHNCARHIVAAGLKRVVYIEPYAKSLAEDLHGDSIAHADSTDKLKKVIFENFEGTAPGRYTKFFGYSRPRKDERGKPVPYDILPSHHVDPQYLDSYGDSELKVALNVTHKLGDESLRV